MRVAEAPVGGARIAWSYLATLVAVLVAGLFWAMWSPFGATVCGDGEDVLCILGWGSAGAILGAVAGLGLAAFVFRLGWEWWAVMAAFIVSLPLWSTALPLEMLWTPFLGAPLAAALTTLGGPRRPAWRPWVIGGLFAALVVATALVTFVL